MKINFTSLASLPRLFAKYQVILAIVFCSLTLGFTAYQISLIQSILPDEAYLAAQKEQQKDLRIKNDSATLKILRELQSAGDVTPHFDTGKKDPFSL